METVNISTGDSQQNTAVPARALVSARFYQKHCMQHFLIVYLVAGQLIIDRVENQFPLHTDFHSRQHKVSSFSRCGI